MGICVGIDTGRTFTDLVAIDEDQGVIHTSKEPSDPGKPLTALQAVLRQSGIDLQRVVRAVLGTTVATDAILERRGAKVLFLTTHGIEDVLFIQRINRPRNYDLHWQKPTPLVKRHHCLGVHERVWTSTWGIRRLLQWQAPRVASGVRNPTLPIKPR